MVTSDDAGILVTLPNGETRKLSPGPSSELVKAVIEKFAKNFLRKPVALLISESSKKILIKDDELCNSIGLKIDVSTVLPDIILMDLGSNNPLLFFIECVATDGPINDRRKKQLSDIAAKAKFTEKDCVHVTVFKDRIDSVSRKLNPSIAWKTFVWYATEPSAIVYLHKRDCNKVTYISDLVELTSDV